MIDALSGSGKTGSLADETAHHHGDVRLIHVRGRPLSLRTARNVAADLLGIGGRAALFTAILFAVYTLSYAPLVRLAFGSARIASYPVSGVWKFYTPLLQLMQIPPFRSLMFGWGMVWDVGQNIDSTSENLLARSAAQGDFTHGLLTGLLLGIGIPALLELRARARSR